jgi:hypothetical protein
MDLHPGVERRVTIPQNCNIADQTMIDVYYALYKFYNFEIPAHLKEQNIQYIKRDRNQI